MFLGIVMACGLNGGKAVAGCDYVSSPQLTVTYEECKDWQDERMYLLENSLPDGAWISYADCVEISTDT